MKSYGHNLLRMLSMLFLVSTLCLVTFVFGQEEYTQEELTAMTDDELERICLARGFTISRDAVDPDTGNPYDLSHEDFVEAARQCLEIEQEMNELLAEYPELRTEVEEEIKKLEAEQMARMAEVEMLEKELAKSQEAAAERANSSSGPAFVASPEPAGKTGTKGDDDFEIIDDGDSTAQVQSDVPIVEDEFIQETIQGTTEVAAKNESGEDLTMKAITFEIIRELIKQVESDVKRIVVLLTPVIRPILSAGDVAWRHLRVAVESLWKNYEKSKAGEEEKVQEAAPS